MVKDFYKLTAKTPSGQTLPMENFRGKLLLIANTATKCGLTPQLRGLENLYTSYKNQGLEVLGFPCNQFAWQEPLSNDNMEEACFNSHRVTFQLTEKVHVNGPKTDPVFKFLKRSKKGLLINRISWNFTKFLVNGQGEVIKRYSPKVLPKTIEYDIQQLLSINT
jgi:glutathione peroxidase